MHLKLSWPKRRKCNLSSIVHQMNYLITWCSMEHKIIQDIAWYISREFPEWVNIAQIIGLRSMSSVNAYSLMEHKQLHKLSHIQGHVLLWSYISFFSEEVIPQNVHTLLMPIQLHCLSILQDSRDCARFYVGSKIGCWIHVDTFVKSSQLIFNLWKSYSSTTNLDERK